MKKLVGAVIALSALSSVAFAQGAYNADEGPAPASYPMCHHPNEDRCMQGPMHGEHRHGRHHGH